jgi:CheY-like chemotaxis protein
MTRLLVVDDSELVRTQIRRTLVRVAPDAVVRVDFAASFTEAAGLDPASYTRALLDLDLGDGDGATLAEVLRAKDGARPGGARLRVAFFTSETAETGGDTWRRAQTQSGGTCFSKPDDLTRAVRWLLGGGDDATFGRDAERDA